jgi:hypothetical protein
VKSPGRVGGAEVVAASVLVFLGSVGVAGYLLDAAGWTMRPVLLLCIAIAGAAVTGATLGRRADWRAGDISVWLALVLAAASWLLWLARPDFMPPGTGTDLTHHLQLIRFIEDHWRLSVGPLEGEFLGEMAVYTPASHILIAAAGTWTGSDGTRALYPILALVAGLKVGLVWLIARRLIANLAPVDVAEPASTLLAIFSSLWLFAAPRYFLGPFIDFSFVAQVVAELFALAMWWTLTVWEGGGGSAPLLLFGIFGSATFLSWPILIGPPVLTVAAVTLVWRRMPLVTRMRAFAIATAPIAVVALIFTIHRTQFVRIAGASGEATPPAVTVFGWPFLLLAIAGTLIALQRFFTSHQSPATSDELPATNHQPRASSHHPRAFASTLFLLLAIGAQAAGLYAFATANHNVPYMAMKTLYLLVYPMSVLAAVAIAWLWSTLVSSLAVDGLVTTASLVTLIVATGWLVVRPLLPFPKALRRRPPAATASLYEAGMWARRELPPACFEYLVGNDNTGYWLHLAVLGNRRISPRSANPDSFEPQLALTRWLTPGGLPYAIADLPSLPRSVREDLEIVRSFGTAAVVRRKNLTPCTARP